MTQLATRARTGAPQVVFEAGWKAKVCLRTFTIIVSTIIVSTAFGATVACADSVADFYRGKVLTLYVAGGIAGPYDLRARTIEPYLRKYIPGSPSIVVQPLPGAGGVRGANMLFNTLPKDGTALALLQPTVTFNQTMQMPGIQYDAGRFNYLGSLDPLHQSVIVPKSVPVRTLADVRRVEVALGSSGQGSSSWIVPALMNRYLGTKFRIVSGYNGMSDILLAIERGEIGGIANNWYGIATLKPDWQPGKNVFAIAHSGLTRLPELPDTPTLIELAETAAQRQMFEFFAVSTVLGVLMVAPPDVPAGRLAALHKAADAIFADPDFLADAKVHRVSVHPMSGAEVDQLVKKALATPPEVVQQMRSLLETK